MTCEDFDLEQYRALRAEILRAMEDGNQVMSFGLAAIGIVISAALGVRDTMLGFIIFAAIVPILSALVLSIWFAGYERLGRASYFITGIEARLKKTNVVDLPTWDSWLRTINRPSSSQHHFWSTEYSGTGLFACLFLSSLVLSLLAGGQAVDLDVKIWTTSLGLVGFLAFGYLIWKRIKRTKAWLSSMFGDLE